MNIDLVNKRLKFLEQLNAQENYWIISPDTVELIKKILLQNKPKNILEIGTSIGYSTLQLAKYSPIYSHIFTIESSKKRIPIAQDTFSQTDALDKINLIIGHAPEVLEDQVLRDKKWDMLFIDCGKKYYLEIVQKLIPNLNKNCIIIADNVISHGKWLTEQYILPMQQDHRFTTQTTQVGAGLEISKFIG